MPIGGARSRCPTESWPRTGYDNANQLTNVTYTVGPATLGTLTYAYDSAGYPTSVGGTLARTGLPTARRTTPRIESRRGMAAASVSTGTEISPATARARTA